MWAVKGKKEIPFYVGKSEKLRGKIGDYLIASFQASTDFKVGEAMRYFQEKGYKVIIRYLPTARGELREYEED